MPRYNVGKRMNARKHVNNIADILSSQIKKQAPAKKVAVQAIKRVKKLEHNFEKKYFNGSYTTALVATGDVFNLTAIAQGDTALTRDANDVTLRSIRLLGRVILTATNTSTPTGSFSQSYRLIIFQDKQQVADTDPAVTDVLLTATIDSVYNYPAVKERFKILEDRVYTLGRGKSVAGYGNGDILDVQPHNHWVFPTMKKMMFNGANATDQQKGAVYALLICDALTSGAGAEMVLAPSLEWQVCFNDN